MEKLEISDSNETFGGNTTGFSVIARSTSNKPVRIGHQEFTNKEWTTVGFQEAKPGKGVPHGKGVFGKLLDIMGLLEYETAQALRWWFLADCRANGIGS